MGKKNLHDHWDSAQSGETREPSSRGVGEGPDDNQDRAISSKTRELQNRLDQLKVEVERYEVANSQKEDSAEANRRILEATSSAHEAVFSLRKAELGIELAQAESQKLKTDREVQALEDQRLLLESQIGSLHADRDELRRELHESGEAVLRLEAQHSELQEQEENLHASLEKIHNECISQDERLENLQAEIDAKLAEADLQAQAQLEQADLRAQTILTAAEQEADQRDKRAADQQAQRTLKAEKELAQWEKNKRREFALGLKRTLDQRTAESLLDELHQTSNIKLDPPEERRMARQLRRRLHGILASHPLDDVVASHYQYDSSTALRTRYNSRVIACGLVVGIAVVLGAVTYSDPERFTAPEQTAEDIFIDKVQQSRSDARFQPTKQPQIKEAYWASVLYTEDYVDRIGSDIYRKAWVVELNRWMIDKRELDDRAIIALIPAEKQLVRDLVEIAQHLRSDEIESGIKRLQDRERSFKDQLARVLENEEGVKAFYDFRQDFFVRFFTMPNADTSDRDVDEGHYGLVA